MAPREPGAEDEAEGERAGRWAWVHEWRARIRVPSRARAASGAQADELEVLVQEKRREELP